MNESSYSNLSSKKWRAITTNWEILSLNDNTEGRLYCLTDFQVAWLLSVTEYFRWSTRWENCPCTQNDMDALKAEMDYNLMSCMDFKAWQLQALFDGMSTSQIGVFTSDWDGSLPSSVNSNAPDDFFNGDDSGYRNDALCSALTIWTYSYVLDWSSKASVILGVVNVVNAFLDNIIGVGGNVAVTVLRNLIDPLLAQFEAMQNIQEVDRVICDWILNLDGVAITALNWNSAVETLSYTVNSEAWYIHDAISSDTNILGNFLSFVNSLGNSFELAQNGISICPCNDQLTKVITFDGLGFTDYSVIAGNIDNLFGNPDPSLNSVEQAGGNAIAWVRVDFSALVTYQGANFDSYNNTHPTGHFSFIRLRDALNNVIATYQSPLQAKDAWRNWSNSNTVINVKAIEFFSAQTRPQFDNIWIDNCQFTYTPQ